MPFFDFRSLIDAYTGPGFFFIQVGANDGVTDDDIRPFVLEHRWRGLLVEPLPDVFARLKENYVGQDRLRFANVAITSGVGRVRFLRHPTLPQCSGLGVRTRIQSRASMEEVEVSATTFESLLGEHGVDRLDLLQIDTEGYDGEMIRLFPFGVISPLIIRYEHKHLKMDERHEVENLLSSKGYVLFWEKNDTVAYLPMD
jgi:FkbM family methyltransferase